MARQPFNHNSYHNDSSLLLTRTTARLTPAAMSQALETDHATPVYPLAWHSWRAPTRQRDPPGAVREPPSECRGWGCRGPARAGRRVTPARSVVCTDGCAHVSTSLPNTGSDDLTHARALAFRHVCNSTRSPSVIVPMHVHKLRNEFCTTVVTCQVSGARRPTWAF
jgi:hypothetical protein